MYLKLCFEYEYILFQKCEKCIFLMLYVIQVFFFKDTETKQLEKTNTKPH